MISLNQCAPIKILDTRVVSIKVFARYDVLLFFFTLTSGRTNAVVRQLCPLGSD